MIATSVFCQHSNKYKTARDNDSFEILIDNCSDQQPQSKPLLGKLVSSIGISLSLQ